MRKIVSLLLALMIAAGLNTVVFAEETNSGTGDRTGIVYGSYVDENSPITTVYSVDVDWEGMEFTYHAAINAVWDSENHEYTGAQDARWEGNGTITVTNHSNAPITAAASYTPATGFESVSMNFSDSSLNIQSAAQNNQAETRTITVTPGGTLPKIDSKTSIGTITVTIAGDEEEPAAKTPLEEAKERLAEAQTVYNAIKDPSTLEAELAKAYRDLYDGIDALQVMIAWGEAGDESAWTDQGYATLEEAFNETYETCFGRYEELKQFAGI